MKRLVFFITLGLAVQFSASAQKNFWKSKNAYLGQKPPTDTPLVFANSMLVPDSGIAMDRSAFSADGKEFYYCNAQAWFSGRTRIRYFKFDGKKWQGPTTLVQGYATPTFSMDGQTLYMAGGKGDGKHAFFWALHRRGDGWSQQPEAAYKMNFGFYMFMPTLSGAGYVSSNGRKGNRRDFKTYDFCSFKINGKDTVIQSLGPEINTPAFDGDFYVAPDESYMIVSYKEKPDYECELGISFRRKDGTWPAPINLGPLINDGDAHRWGEYVTPDGKYLFYTKGHNDKDCHLYWVRFDTLKKRLQAQVK